jgi:hypothetical protein
MMNTLLLKIESRFQSHNKQKRPMSKLPCFVRRAFGAGLFLADEAFAPAWH